MFDPNSFMEATFTEANSTRLNPVPVGDYHAQIIELKPKSGTISKGDKTGEPWAGVDVVWKVEDAGVEAMLGREPRVRQNVFLDLTPEGMIDMSEGKNIGLGKLREATNTNAKGMPFKFPDLIGKRALIKVTHRPNPNDSTIVYDEVSAVAKA